MQVLCNAKKRYATSFTTFGIKLKLKLKLKFKIEIVDDKYNAIHCVLSVMYIITIPKLLHSQVYLTITLQFILNIKKYLIS